MQNYFKIILLFVVFSFVCCTTSKTTISKNANLAKYEYVSVINDGTYYLHAELMEYEILLFDAIEASRLQLISDVKINELTYSERNKLLLVRYVVNSNENEAIITVNFIDYMTGRPVVSCRGAFGLGIDNAGDLRGAIKRVSKQISETFPK